MKIYTTTRLEDLREIRDYIDNLIERIELGWDIREEKKK